MSNLLVAALVRNIDEDAEPARVVLIGTATDVLAAGGGVGIAARRGPPRRWTGQLGPRPPLAGLVYIAVQSVEFTVGWRRAIDTG